LVNVKKKAVLPVVLQRQQLADSLTRCLVTLGLERRQAAPLSLSEYLASRNSENCVPEAAPGPKRATSEDPTTEASSKRVTGSAEVMRDEIEPPMPGLSVLPGTSLRPHHDG
jgi:hypothetical protein